MPVGSRGLFGGAFVAPPGPPVVCFDATRTDTLFADAAGTVPIAPVDGAVVRHWKSVGTLDGMSVSPLATYLDTTMAYRPAGTHQCRPLVQFTGLPGGYTHTTVAGFSIPAPLGATGVDGGATMVLVLRFPASAIGTGRFWGPSGGNGHLPYLTTIEENFGAVTSRATTSTAGLYDTTFIYAAVASPTAGVRTFLNSPTVVRNPTSLSVYQTSGVLGEYSVVNWNGWLAEFRLYRTALGAAQRRLVFAELGAKFGLTIPA